MTEILNNNSAPMIRAREIVEDHIFAYGMVPNPDKLKEAIATELAKLAAATGAAFSNSVIPCSKGPTCNWPACSINCDGRPGTL